MYLCFIITEHTGAPDAHFVAICHFRHLQPVFGPRTSRFGPRAFISHRISPVFGRYLCFVIPRNPAVSDTHFAAKHHFRCLQPIFGTPNCAVWAPSVHFSLVFVQFWQVPLFQHQEDHWGGGRPVIIPDNQFCSSGARFAHFRANVEYPGDIFFQPKLHICDEGTWEDPKSGGRPVIVVFIFEPPLQVQCCDSCFTVAKLQPWGLVLHT